MLSLPTFARNFQPSSRRYTARLQTYRKQQEIRCRASLSQVRDQNYGAAVLDANRHGANVLAVYDWIRTELETLQDQGADRIACHISKNIALLVRQAGLDLSPYQARGAAADEYGKYLLFSSLSLGIPALRKTPFCIQLFHFDAGQTTPIHNHPCECASLVLAGEINEHQYVPAGSGLVNETRSWLRREGDRSELEVEHDNLPHRLKNHGGQRCVTVHVYAIDGMSANQTSAVQTIFIRSPWPI